jgi:hypothetical protein
MRKLFILPVLIAVFPQLLHAQSRKYSNEFLNIGVGSRAFGMSNAVVASSNDVTAGYWNPAGLTNMTGNFQLGLMHSEYFAGIAKYDYAAVATPIDAQSYGGISIIRFGVDDIPNTTELIDANGNVNYDRITSFSAVDYAFLVSYARKMKNEKLSVGGNVKVIHRKIGEFGKSWGFGIDAAAQYKYNNHFTFAAMFKDVTSTFNAWSYTLNDRTKEVFTATGNEIPENSVEITRPKIILGIVYQTKISPKFNIATEIDADIATDGPRNVLWSYSTSPISLDPHLGVEVDYRKIVYLRGGVGNIQKTTDFDGKKVYTLQPNMGVGLKIKNLYIDYALTDIGNSSDALYSNVFSLRLDIFKSVTTNN